MSVILQVDGLHCHYAGTAGRGQVIQTSRTLEPLATLAMLNQLAETGGDLGIQMPHAAEIKVFCGGSAIARAHFRRLMAESHSQAAKLSFVDLSEGIDAQPVALELLPGWLPSLDEAKRAPWWVIRHTLNGRPDINLFKALGRIRATMTKARTRCLLILSTDDTMDYSDLEHMADEYLIVAGCEDGLKSAKCISFERPGATAFMPFTSDKVMCSIFKSSNNLGFHFEPFVSSELDVRVMARLRGADRTYAEIGQVVRMDKSTTLRRLRGVQIIPGTVSPKWLKAVEDHYGARDSHRQRPDSSNPT